MSNEKIDDFLAWRGRLDHPQGVPGHGLDDHEATWERLMDKISETPRRRRFFGYQLIAACLLLVLIPAVRFFQDRHDHILSVRPVEPKRVVSPIPVAPPVAIAPPPHHPAVPQVAATRREKPSKPLPPQLAILRTFPATITVTPPDTSVAQLTAKPLKNKPLRVVHINELSGRDGPEPAVTASDVQRHFEIFLSPSHSRLAMPPPPQDPVLLKVKLSSQN
jgi:hypothetical protein